MSKPKRRRTRLWFLLLLEAGLLLSIFFGVRLWLDQQALGQAPQFTAQRLEAGPVSLAQYTDEGPVAIRFWAVWCPNCMREHDMIDRLATEGHVLTIAMQSGEEADVAAYLDAESLTMPTIVDDGRIAGQYGVVAVPTTFIVDRDGRIRFRLLGLPGEWGLRWRLWAARWL
ncbi:MAG: TlpA disulfide reductase family protein [Pseudomonadota bacterium]